MVRDAVVKTGDLVEGRYRIIQTLGSGGMGTVFLAEHAMIKRRVAIKILHADLAAKPLVVEAFMNEARAAGTLGHPNIVESTDMGYTGERVPYIVYELIEGALLTDEIYRVGGLTVRRAVRIAAQIASALDTAHRAGIVHRDLKSDNIFLTDKDDALDHVKVLDFGVSRFLAAGDHDSGIVGTPEFMAPEQITSPGDVDKRADIYALGVILYEMLTARRPFSIDDDPRLLMHYIVTKAPPPLLRNEVPHGLSTMILEKLLAKDPDERYQTMGDVQAALETFITRSDATPMPRRSAPSIVQALAAEAETSIRLPTRKTAGARPTPSAFSPLDTPVALSRVSLPSLAGKRPYALYGVAGAGILMGTIGLVVGLRGSEPAPVAAPVIVQPAASVAPPPVRPAPAKIEVKLGADVANARVVFRRRVQPAPIAMEINASDVVELVEVAAPGHKTTRYWLTFDRPTYLTAHLVKGNGSVEATEEETLAALGEVIVVSGKAPVIAAAPTAPSPVAGAARVVVPTEKTLERKPVAATTDALAPRKIGRAAATETPPVVEPTPEPAAVAVAVAEPTPEPKAAEPPAPEPTPAPEPKPVAAPPVEESLHVARPTIDRGTMASVITTHRPQVLKCFAEGKKRSPSMKGTLTLQLQVSATGAVQRVQVQSTLSNPLVAACVVKAANTWKFPERAGGESATVAYPFTFN
jgi:serine/threonine protein kinase/outer membrane biosynthesis protein TonB